MHFHLPKERAHLEPDHKGRDGPQNILAVLDKEAQIVRRRSRHV